MTAFLDAALDYAAAGYPVFPLRGKQPLTEHGFKDASRDTGTIREWWTTWPEAGIGVPTGAESGIVVLDVDPRNGGDAALKDLEKEGPLPPCPRAKTGGGGWHLWFAHPGGAVKTVHGFRPGLDLQSDAAYVVVPPSQHPSGGVYTWQVPLNGTPLPILPPWLLKLADGGGSGRAGAPVELGPDGKLPHGRHHDWLLSFTASFASKTGGVTVAEVVAAARAAFAEVGDDLPTHEAEIVTLARSAIEKFGRAARAPESTTDGPALFREVRETLTRYLYWPHAWCYDLGALWVMEAYISETLPSVFYLFFSATKGRGKTTALDVLAGLTGALNASNISVAALVHALKATPGRAVCCDEFDVARDAERDSALASIARDGYTPGKPYLRWDPVHKVQDECPTFGAKAFGFRGNVDDALEDRGFTLPLPTVSLRGREGAELVLRNYRRDYGNLTLRLTRWAAERKKMGLPEVTAEAWLARVEEVVGAEACGANRETQLAGVVLAVGDAVGVDVTESLRAALGLRREIAEANVDLGVEEAREILEKMIGETGTLTKEAEFHVIRQKEFADALNARRRERHERPLTSSQVAKLRNDLGIDPAWLTHPLNRTVWNIPKREWERRQGVPNMANMPNIHGIDGNVSHVRHVSQGAPEPPSGPTPPESQGHDPLDPLGPLSRHERKGGQGGLPRGDPEDLLGPGPTLADLAMRNAREEGSVPPDPPGKEDPP